MRQLASVRPGWYVLLAVIVYAVVVSVMLRASQTQVRELRAARVAAAAGGGASTAPGRAAAPQGTAPDLSGPTANAAGTQAPPGLWFPLPGALVPKNAADLPGASRPYRHGVSQGFDFADGDAGIPVAYGQPVIAAAAGEIVRADSNYVEMRQDAWRQLLDAVGGSAGANADQLDQLRGRQIWERLADGRVLRYGFLSGVRDGITKGIQVYRGEVIGYVGNSGTGDGVAGTTLHPRLHFEIWQGDSFFGEGLTPDEVRMRAASLFAGP